MTPIINGVVARGSMCGTPERTMTVQTCVTKTMKFPEMPSCTG
eukprot:CAMPEP_0179146458 /NCGR_PEP_ID=MMETSP0796-20121207/70720_1 /TAXON_ID=73915 /ORGANISM="Pyrodinium bahamense, Strain pbaha01" /LENGTH=42 /DNA_ID= /DNA_START= /DNA_END= /DNA_ORIENTATION=